MSISRVKPGDWTYPADYDLTAAEIAAVDANFSYSLDTRSGQTDTGSSTVAWTAGGLTTSGTASVTCSTDLTVSASSGEIQLYGAGGAVSSSNKFPKIQGSTVELTHFLSVTEAKPIHHYLIGVGTVKIWNWLFAGESAPYLQTDQLARVYGGAIVWTIPKVHGATIASAKAWVQGTETTFPARLATLDVLKTTRSSGATVSLSSTGAASDSVTTLAAYNQYRSITFTCDQNNTSLNLGNGDDYTARFLCSDSTTDDNMKVFGLSVTYQVTRFAPAL